MSLADMFEQLARIVPGVAGYQDKDAARETDKSIRLRLSSELEQLKRVLEGEKRYYIDQKDLSPLPILDRETSKLDKLENQIKYAGRGYRGYFDVYKHDENKLNQLCEYDLRLFDELVALKANIKKLQESRSEVGEFKQAIEQLGSALDHFEVEFMHRDDILTRKNRV